MSADAVAPASVAVIGAGTMGAGIAQVFAQAGYPVVVHDVSAGARERALAGVTSSLERFVARGTIDAAARDAALARLTWTDQLDACSRADLIVEAIVEDPAAKRALFASLDTVCPSSTVFASNTSSVSITTLGAATGRADRVVGLHFMNPVPLMPLVELVRGQATSDDTMALARQVCDRLGKTAIEAADYPGFIANRILMPMINEAVFALMEGVGTAEAIDGVMTLGMKHPMGPLTLADFIGLDVCVAILDVMHEGLGDPKYRACPLLRRMVAAGHFGRKSGQGFYTYN
jgi:3-hydroxybutyryl-CoA dehydrogenase